MSFVAVTVAFALTVGYGVAAQRRAARDAELLRSGYLPLVLSLGAALENQNLVSTQLNHITEARNPSDARRWIETARRVRPKVFADVRQTATTGVMPSTDGEARQLGERIVADVDGIEAYLSADGDRFAKLFEALATGRQDQAERLRDDIVAHEAEGARRIREVKGRVEAEMDRLTAGARERERRSLQSLIALAALTLSVTIGMTLYARRVLGPLAQVMERANAVAAGDMTARPVVEAKDEIGELAATFESMVEAIGKANRDRVQAERLAAVGRMAAHVTHEIRNPLSSIGLNLELLEEEMELAGVGAEARQLVGAIRREVDHLSSLSEEYLSLARPKTPRLEAEGLAEIVREAATFVAPELARSAVELRLEVDDGLPDVLVDESQLRQALSNLVRNAREAMPKGGVLTIGLHAVRGDVELSVGDTGQGIPDEIRQNIFDPFFTTKNRGTGLGLAITRQIVEAHHGEIACDAVEPHGTRFRIRLRASAASEAT